jgi:hypothetical protein
MSAEQGLCKCKRNNLSIVCRHGHARIIRYYSAGWSINVAAGLMGLIYGLHVTLRLRWPQGLFLS